MLKECQTDDRTNTVVQFFLVFSRRDLQKLFNVIHIGLQTDLKMLSQKYVFIKRTAMLSDDNTSSDIYIAGECLQCSSVTLRCC